MKNWTKMLVILGVLLVGIGGMLPQASAVSITMFQENELYFQNHEAVFDKDGNYVTPDPARGIIPRDPGPDGVLGTTDDTPGDHFVGIINVQNIDVAGTTIWMQSFTDQLSGLFAQEVWRIANAPGTPDPFDPGPDGIPGTGDESQLLPHLVLGPAARTTFSDPNGNSFDISPWLTPSNNEIMSLWTETGAGTSVYESNGTMSQDISVATSGSLWAKFGHANGADGIWGPEQDSVGNWYNDDDGYFYSHVSIGLPLANFTGETWAGLDAIVNNTGFVFADINDPSEVEMDLLIANLFNDMYMSGELEPNPNSVNIDQDLDRSGHQPGISPWDLRSNDPAHINPVPEPATMLLLGTGLLGLAGFARRKLKKLS